MQRFLYPSLLASLFFFFSLQNIFASSPYFEVESLSIEMNITFSSEPELDKNFTVTFSFKPIEDVPHFNRFSDEAEVTFDNGLKSVRGKPIWTGRLRKDHKESIKLILKPITEGKHTIRGYVGSCQYDPRLIGEDLEYYLKTGKRRQLKAFKYHNSIEKEFMVGEIEEGVIETYIIDVKTGERKKIKIKEPPKIEQSLKPSEKDYGVPIKSGGKTSDTLEITLCRRLTPIVFLYDPENGMAVKAEWRCEPEDSCKIEILSDNRVRVTSLSSQQEYLITGTYKGCEYRIRILK